MAPEAWTMQAGPGYIQASPGNAGNLGFAQALPFGGLAWPGLLRTLSRTSEAQTPTHLLPPSETHAEWPVHLTAPARGNQTTGGGLSTVGCSKITGYSRD